MYMPSDWPIFPHLHIHGLCLVGPFICLHRLLLHAACLVHHAQALAVLGAGWVDVDGCLNKRPGLLKLPGWEDSDVEIWA